jgi:hypothetical protein
LEEHRRASTQHRSESNQIIAIGDPSIVALRSDPFSDSREIVFGTPESVFRRVSSGGRVRVVVKAADVAELCRAP